MRYQKKLFRDAQKIANDLTEARLRQVLLEIIREQCSPENGDTEQLTDYLMREIGRRITQGVSKGQAVITLWNDLGCLTVHTLEGRGISVVPVTLLIAAERLSLGLRDVISQLTALSKAIQKHFDRSEQLQALQVGFAVIKAVFEREVDEVFFAPILRMDDRAMKLAVAVALEHKGEHSHDQRPPAALAVEPVSKRVRSFIVALPDALSAVGVLRSHEVKHGGIMALARYFTCAYCLLTMAQGIITGAISADIVREFARHVGWLKEQAVPLDAVRRILEWHRQYNPPFDFRATVELGREIADVVALPSGLETLLRYSADPATIRVAAQALRKHHLTLAWLVASYRDCAQKIPLAKYVAEVGRFGERTKTLTRLGGEHPEAFLETCAQIGVNRARAVARRVQPVQARPEIYSQLNALQQAHPRTPLRALHAYLQQGFTEPKIALGVRTHELYHVPHAWLVRAHFGTHTPETLALTYLFERELKCKPAAWELDLLAWPEFLREMRRRGLKRALRSHGEWFAHVLTIRNAHQTLSQEPDQSATEGEQAKPAGSARISRPRPQDPRQLRFWVAWRIVRRMWAGRQFGASNVSPEDQKARNLPSDLIGMFDEVYAVLVKDGIILTRAGQYIRASLNPERLGMIHTILNYEIPPGGALEEWVKRASK